MLGRRRTRPSPKTGELVSLAERAGTLGALRCGFLLVVLGFALFLPLELVASPAELTVGSLVYPALLAIPWTLWRRSGSAAVMIIGGTLLIDGLYLAWAIYSTGGTQSPLWFLVFAHVVGVTLLGSYRTGLKISCWHSLLLLVVLYAQAAEVIPVREGLASALPGSPDFGPSAIVSVGAIWAIALGAALCAAVRERELRAQKVDLEELSAMVSEMDRRANASEVPAILLDALCRAFGFQRGVVLASPEGDLAVIAHRGIDESPAQAPGIDRVVERAWRERRTQLARELDSVADPRLSMLLPEARNVLVVPLHVEQGTRLGVVALEHPKRRQTVGRWSVTVIEQFAAHAALALQNSWLREQVEQRLTENRQLQQKLVAQNLDLELNVQERTRDLSESMENLRATDEQRRLLLARLVHAEEDERKRIAGDIHDDPIQKLAAAGMWLQLLRRELSEPKQLQVLETLVDVVGRSVESLRTLIFRLRPNVLDEQGLGPALREYLDSLQADFDDVIEDRLELEPPGELRVVLYRMAQEALANISKHARASTVHVLLTQLDGGFLVRISDDGVGFTSPPSRRSARGHLGLTSMRERAEMAGGRCRVHSLPGAGTTVEFWVPGDHPAPSAGGPAPSGMRTPAPVAMPERAIPAEGHDPAEHRPAVPA